MRTQRNVQAAHHSEGQRRGRVHVGILGEKMRLDDRNWLLQDSSQLLEHAVKMVACLHVVRLSNMQSSRYTSLPTHVQRTCPSSPSHTHALAQSPNSSRFHAPRLPTTPKTPGMRHTSSCPGIDAHSCVSARLRLTTSTSIPQSRAIFSAGACSKNDPNARRRPRQKLASVLREDPFLRPPRPCPGPRRCCCSTTARCTMSDACPKAGAPAPACDGPAERSGREPTPAASSEASP